MAKKVNKGSKILISGSLTDNAGTSINFADLVAMSVKLEHSNGTEYETYTKVGGTIVAGDTADDYEFEITVAHSDAFATGLIFGIFTLTVTDADFSDSEAVYEVTQTLLNVQDKS